MRPRFEAAAVSALHRPFIKFRPPGFLTSEAHLQLANFRLFAGSNRTRSDMGHCKCNRQVSFNIECCRELGVGSRFTAWFILQIVPELFLKIVLQLAVNHNLKVVMGTAHHVSSSLHEGGC